MKKSDTEETKKTKKIKKGFYVRLPTELRARIDQARAETGQSVNAEMIALLEAGLDAEKRDLLPVIRDLKVAVDKLTRRLDNR
jgi:hypothetical protein